MRAAAGVEPGPPHLPVAPGARRHRRGDARRRQDRHDAEGHRPGVRRQGPPRRAARRRRRRPRRRSPPTSRRAPSPRTARSRPPAASALDVDEVVARFTELGARLAPYVVDTVGAAPRGARRRPPPPARGRPGDVPRPRPRHLSVRHVVQPDGGRGLRRHRPRPPRHRPRRRDHQGLHDTRRRRAVPDRADRRRRRHARRRRPGVRHRHRAPPAGRLARLRDAAPRRAAQQPHRAGAHEARRARRLRRRSRSAPTTASTAAR